MKKFFLIICIFVVTFSFKAEAQSVDSLKAKTYPFTFFESKGNLFTMRQSNEGYLSLYRIISRTAYQNARYKPASYFVAFVPAVMMSITHEEGHRAILTNEDIGAISRPFSNSRGAAYVQGVTDATLQNLRDTKFPVYIRLHTAGLESDYMLTHRVEQLLAFNDDGWNNLVCEYAIRKYAILNYYFSGLLGSQSLSMEEDNELRRDIVGHDIYGAVRHLHRPTAAFHRYTKLSTLTSEEKQYVRRAGWLSLLNLASPFTLGRKNFAVGENTRINVGMGYTMAPFGDFIDENFWLQHYNTNLHVYIREFKNRSNWFPACGAGLYDVKLMKQLRCDVVGHFWSQPKELDFNTSKSFSGGAIDATLRYMLFPDLGKVQAISIDLGVMAKTKGFLPEEVNMEKGVSMRFGLSLYY